MVILFKYIYIYILPNKVGRTVWQILPKNEPDFVIHASLFIILSTNVLSALWVKIKGIPD